jgi:hypothetical protein
MSENISCYANYISYECYLPIFVLSGVTGNKIHVYFRFMLVRYYNFMIRNKMKLPNDMEIRYVGWV